jgi:indolepyruvate decarboxylase
VLPGAFLARYNFQKAACEWIEATGLPFATMVMDKGVLNETHPQFAGMYDGNLLSDEVRGFVEGADLLLLLGPLLTDHNTGAFTANIDKRKTIHVRHHQVVVKGEVYNHVEIGEVLKMLCRIAKKKAWPALPPRHATEDRSTQAGSSDQKLTAKHFFSGMQSFFREGDIIIVETGSSSMGSYPLRLPKDACFHSLVLWGAIGWATPAALGAAVAAPDRRVVLITGEGSFQIAPQDICQFYRLGLKPVIFLLNNQGYLIERLLCDHPDAKYNDVPSWNYLDFVSAMGIKDAVSEKIETARGLDAALAKRESAQCTRFYEIILDKMDAPELLQNLAHTVHSKFSR